MTEKTTREATDTVGPITDPESLRERSDVPFHEEEDVVDGDTVETVEDLDDMAITGVTNDDDGVLLMRVTETCTLKPPSETVDDEDFAAAAREWVRVQSGLTVELEAIEGVWRYAVRAEDGERTAERYFVVFSASPTAAGVESDDLPTADAEGDGAATADWYDELPDEAAEAPGIDLFFD